jgi:hypothetical protein
MRSPQRPGAIERDEPSAARRGRRLGVALGAGAAALVSAGLAYWMSAGGDRSLSSAPHAAAPPAPEPQAAAPRDYAAPRPDAGQVQRAYDQVQEIYADQGSAGVIGFSRSCAETVRSDPGVLDFCLAFDVYAAALEGDDPAAREWAQQAPTRDLDLARASLPPGQDPSLRLAEVRALARQTSLETPDAADSTAAESALAESPAAPQRAPGNPSPANSHRTSTQAHETGATHAKRASAATACRRKPTAGERAVCASPALRDADRRLRLAYRRAVAAGVSPRRLAHEQARFRAAVNAAAPNRAAIARLYHRRTRTLEKLAHAARSSGD